ncbi:MAG: phosphatase PAP2 family protein [Phyllobacterium sp.]
MTQKNTQSQAEAASHWFSWSAKRCWRSFSFLAQHVSRAPKKTSPPFWSASTIAILIAVGLGIAALLPFDEVLATRLSDLEHPLVDIWRALTDLGLDYPYVVVSAVVALLFGGLDRDAASDRNRVRLKLIYMQAMFVFASFGLSSTATYLGKFFVGRARPKFMQELGADHLVPFSFGHDFASFPSGHATAFGTLAAILSIWFPRWRGAILPLFILLAFSRVAVGAHYPTDVVAGFSIGMLMVIWFARFLARKGIGFRFIDGRIMPAVVVSRWDKTLV